MDRRADRRATRQRPEIQGKLARCASGEQLPIELDGEDRGEPEADDEHDEDEQLDLEGQP